MNEFELDISLLTVKVNDLQVKVFFGILYGLDLGKK